MSELKWIPQGPTAYRLDDQTTIGGIVGVFQHEFDPDKWRGVVGVKGENYYTDWMYLNQAMQAVQTLMKEHGVTVKESESSFPAETQPPYRWAQWRGARGGTAHVEVQEEECSPEPEPLTIDEYMYRLEKLANEDDAHCFRFFEFVPAGVSRSRGVAINAQTRSGTPVVLVTLISDVSFIVEGKQSQPQGIYLTPEDARFLAQHLEDFAKTSETLIETKRREAMYASKKRVDKLRQQNADANPA